MVFCGLLALIGGLFGTFLFSINWSFGDKTARDISLTFLFIAFVGLCLITFDICREHEYHNVEIKAHYVNGDVQIMKFDTIPTTLPRIRGSRAGYYLDAGYTWKPGVIRFEIIKEEKFTE